MTVIDPLPLMMRYLHGKSELSSDEREILTFALYCENKDIKDSLTQRAIRELQKVDTPIVVARESELKGEQKP